MKYLSLFLDLDDDEDSDEESESNPNLLKPTDIPEEFVEEKKVESPKNKRMRTLTKLRMQLEGEKKVAKKKKTKNTATNIISENIETTNILKGANILLKDKEKKKSKKKGANEKR